MMIWARAGFAALALLAAGGVQAQPSGTQACDRACMQAIGEQYLQALAAHDPGRAPISRQALYTENSIPLRMPDGLWRTISKVRDYRLWVADPATGMLGFFSVVEENGEPLILASRLRIENRTITEIEVTAARRKTAADAGAGTSFDSHPDELRPRPQFTQAVAPADRLPRQKLIEIANVYFDALENNNGVDHVPAFADDCHRLENGFATSDRPVTAAGALPGQQNMSCKDAFANGYYHEDTRLRDRRYLAVDEERGLVFVQIYFDHDATVRRYQLRDGRTQTIARTAPWTWDIAEIFQIRDGKISQIEAVLLAAPYGIRSPWRNGTPMPSAVDEAEKAKAPAW